MSKLTLVIGDDLHSSVLVDSHAGIRCSQIDTDDGSVFGLLKSKKNLFLQIFGII